MKLHTHTAPGNHFVLSSVREKIAGSPAGMVFHTLPLITAFLRPRPHEALLVPQHAMLWTPRRHGTFRSLPPGRPFLSFVAGKLRFILQYTNYKSLTKRELLLLLVPTHTKHPPAQYYHITFNRVLRLSSLKPFECLIFRVMFFS